MDQSDFPPAVANQRKLRQRHLIAMPHWVARGIWEMVCARRLYSRLLPSDVRRLNTAAAASQKTAEPHPEAVSRIAFIIPLLGRRLPWRSDCLIQAIAGQNWLASLGVSSEIRIGADKPSGEELDAHAWLVHRERIVTGGNIERYGLLIGESEAGLDANREG